MVIFQLVTVCGRCRCSIWRCSVLFVVGPIFCEVWKAFFPATSKVSSYWILTNLEKRPDAAWLLVLRDSKNMVAFFSKLWCYSRRQVCFASWICLKFPLSASRWLHRLPGNSGWYVLHWWVSCGVSALCLLACWHGLTRSWPRYLVWNEWSAFTSLCGHEWVSAPFDVVCFGLDAFVLSCGFAICALGVILLELLSRHEVVRGVWD